MPTYCVRLLFTRESKLKVFPWRPFFLRYCRYFCTAAGFNDDCSENVRTLLQICNERHYISSSQNLEDTFRRGVTCNYGPLGSELRKNILDQWWNSVRRSRTQVFGISTVNSTKEGNNRLKVVDVESLNQVLHLKSLSNDDLIQKIRVLLQGSASLRTDFHQGALKQYIPSLGLVNKKLPFGLAETGLCFQPLDGPGCPAEVTQASLVWFCSPRTSSQWLDHWTRQRLQWWRRRYRLATVNTGRAGIAEYGLLKSYNVIQPKLGHRQVSSLFSEFALGPSDFSCSEASESEMDGEASRGIKIIYRFPWGQEPLETLWSKGDAELLQVHFGVRTKLQCRDGRKLVIPHVISIAGNVDRGVMAYLFNSLQHLRKEDVKQRLKQRNVLKLHPVLAPVKVALDMGRGGTVELRQVCEGLMQEFSEFGISAWPGYLEATANSMEQLNAKYDEMGVLFTVVISENTLENGLLQVRSRDTAIKETMHVSEVKAFLTRYLSAAENI